MEEDKICLNVAILFVKVDDQVIAKEPEIIGNRIYLFHTTKYICLSDVHVSLETYFKKKMTMYLNIDGYNNNF